MTNKIPILDKKAPPWRVAQWFNTKQPITLDSLKGSVVVLHAFQMLCPGCVAHGLPQAQRIAEEFAGVHVIGLHTVFEHHQAMTATSLAAFLHEYRIHFPVGIDEPCLDGPTPQTMKAYGMRGTPSLILIGRNGSIKEHFFGRPSDLLVGAAIAGLLADSTRGNDIELGAANATATITTEPGCDDNACSRPSDPAGPESR